MYYEVFLDVLILVNIWMDFFLLRLVNRLLSFGASIKRSILGACIGSAGVCVLLIYPYSRILNILLVHVVINTMMIRFGCGVKKIRELILGVFMLYVATFFIGGFLQYVQTIVDTYRIYIGMLLTAVCYGGVVLLHWYQEKISEKRDYTYIAHVYVNGKCKDVSAFLDNGNQLFDPINKKPVSIISGFAMEEILSAEQVKQLKKFQKGIDDYEVLQSLKPHYVQFRSLG